MKAQCPANHEHTSFRTTAHVAQLWQVDPTGEFLKELDPCLQVTAGPDPGNYWHCLECGALAEFVRDEDDEDPRVARPLAAELDTLIDGVNETTVDSLKARIKEEIHRLLRVP